MPKGVLLDLAGVLYDGEQAIEGAPEAVARLREAGLPVRFLTNSTRAPRRVLLARLRGLGFELEDAEMLTPASAARARLEAEGLAGHFLVHPDLAEDFKGIARPGGAAGHAVVVGDAGPGFTYEALNEAFRALDGASAFFALAANRRFRDADGLLSMDAGAFVAALEYASERRAEVLGKPARAFFAAVLDDMQVPAEEAVMVGDDAESDVSGALAAGVGQAVLVRTGKYSPGDETKAECAPSHVAADIRDAVGWILA